MGGWLGRPIRGEAVMVQYLGPIPVILPEAMAAQAGNQAQTSDSDRLWQRVTYASVVLMTASLAFIVLAMGSDITVAAEEAYYFMLRNVNG